MEFSVIAPLSSGGGSGGDGSTNLIPPGGFGQISGTGSDRMDTSELDDTLVSQTHGIHVPGQGQGPSITIPGQGLGPTISIPGSSLSSSSGGSIPIGISIGGSGGSLEFPSSPPPQTAGFHLSDILTQLEDYQPTIPESLALHFLHSAGFSSTDPRMTKLISLASQKFISDILNDCYTMCKLKGGGTGGGGGSSGGGAKKKTDKKFVLTVEDLIPVLNDYGISIRKPPYYL